MLNILLAEDNRGDILLIREALAEHRIQHELFVVQDGEEALKFVTQMGKSGFAPCPDIMLLDLNLPKADGPQILSQLRKHPECGHIPVIIVTSSDAPRDRAEVADFQVSRYFRKPTQLDDFLELGAVVREVAEDHGIGCVH